MARPRTIQPSREHRTARRPDTVEASGARSGTNGYAAFATRVLVATAVVAAFVLVLLFLGYAADLLLLVFAAILVSIPLRRLAAILRRVTGVGRGISITLALAAVVVLVGLVGTFAAGRVASQWTEFTAQLQSAVQNLLAQLKEYEWVRNAVDQLPSGSEMLFGGGGVLSRLGGVASSTLGIIVNVFVVLVVAIYFASQPHLYSRGLEHLVPIGYRDRIGEVLGALDTALGRWLLGRLALMAINGTLTAIALALLGVPLAFTLGVIAGVLNFIPNFGPFIAAVPAVLIALTGGPQLAIYTALVYVGVQMLDGYVLTPLVDRQSVELPPVLTITAQLLLGVLFGFVGLLVASPLTATFMIVIKMLYVEDVLGDDVMDEGSPD